MFNIGSNLKLTEACGLDPANYGTEVKVMGFGDLHEDGERRYIVAATTQPLVDTGEAWPCVPESGLSDA